MRGHASHRDVPVRPATTLALGLLLVAIFTAALVQFLVIGK
jgi:hypothetical protein